MWTKSVSKTLKNASKEKVWKLWSDVDNWTKWHDDLDFTKLHGPFETGSYFILKPKGGQKVKIRLLEVIKGRTFTDCTHFIGAKMYDIHEMEEVGDGLKITMTMKVTGPLGFLWRKLVAEKVFADNPKHLQDLAILAKKD